MADRNSKPRFLERETLDLARATFTALQPYFATPTPDEVKGRILALLSHYYTPDMDPRVWSMVFQDWFDDLKEYPLWIIREACAQYRRTETYRRPTPAAILALCREEIGYLRRDFEALRRTLEYSDAHTGTDEEPDYSLTDHQRKDVLEKFEAFKQWAANQKDQPQ